MTLPATGPILRRMQTTVEIIVSIHLAFIAYLLLHGQGLKRIFEFEVAALGMTAGVMLICLPFTLFGAALYFGIVFSLSLFVLPCTIFMLNLGEALHRVSVLEVVLINVLAVLVMQPWGWQPLLLNPLRLGGIAGDIFGFWPSLLALLLVARGPPGDLRLRLVLGVWTHVIGLIWLVPVAFQSIIAFDDTSSWAYLESLVASLAAVHVALVAHSLIRVFRGDHAHSGHGMATAALSLAEDVYVRRWNPLLLAGAGVLWWIALKAWLGVAPGAVSAVGVPYVAAFVLGALLMPHRDESDGAPETERPPPIVWRSYKWTIAFALVGVGLLWLVDSFSDYYTLLTTHAASWIVLTISVVAALFVIHGLLAAAWVIADASGRPVGAAGKGVVWLGAIGLLAVYSFVTLPRPHPVGGLDGHEEIFAHGRVYVWYSREFGPFSRQGRAVWFEEAGLVRTRVCGSTDYPVAGFRIEPDDGIECRWPDRVQLVDTRGHNTDGVSISSTPLPAKEITADEAGCRVVAADEPTVRCRDIDYPLAYELNVPGLEDPSSLDAAKARYFRLEQRYMTLTDCIEVPADALLPDGATTGATAIIFIRHAVNARPFWLTDRDGSCGRVYGSGDVGHIYYRWHEQIAPHHGLTQSPLDL